mgnify:CR=1 FL=1
MNFGVIGPGKMGQLYIRDFIKFGAKLTYIKSTNPKKTNKIVNKFKKEEHLNNNNIKSVDFLVISSKTNTHYKYINKFYKKKKLLIEKPFFFCRNKSYDWHLNKAKLFLKSNKAINLNLSNYLFGDIYKKQKKLTHNKNKEFFFTFHTRGNYKYKFIILDLMPHFFSIMQRLTPCNHIKIISRIINKYGCNLVIKVDKYLCYIDLRENQKKRELSFGFDDFIFSRQQVLYKNTIKNFLYNKKYNLRIKTPNPLTNFISNYHEKNGSTILGKKFIYKNFKLTLKTYF